MPIRDEHELIAGDQQETPRSSSSTKLPSNCCSSIFQLFSIFLTSLKIIFLENPKLFLSIYVLTCLPLSLLLTTLSLSSRRLRTHIFHLEWLSNAVELRVEADNIQDEARLELRSLLHLKALYGVPICIFSLLSLTAAVSASLKRRPELRNFPASVRAALTTVVNAAAWISWAAFAWAVVAVVGNPPAVAVAMTAAEVLLMAVLSLALVVSVAEEAAGVAAVKAGWGLMRGRRVVVGWALSGLVVVGSGCVWREMEGVMDGGDWGMSVPYRSEWTVRMRYGYMGGLIMLLGWVILWSYVIFTVFYCDCRQRVGNYASNNSITSGRELEEC